MFSTFCKLIKTKEILHPNYSQNYHGSLFFSRLLIFDGVLVLLETEMFTNKTGDLGSTVKDPSVDNKLRTLFSSSLLTLDFYTVYLKSSMFLLGLLSLSMNKCRSLLDDLNEPIAV